MSGEGVGISGMKRALIYQAGPVNNLKIGVLVAIMDKMGKMGVVP